MKRRTKRLGIAKRFSLALSISLLAASSLVGPARAQQPAEKSDSTPQGNVEKGKAAFMRHSCFSCHGHSGNGGAGPRIAQNPIPFPAFRKYVRRPTKSMPPFGTLVTDSEMTDIYAFLKSIPPSPPLKNIPLLNE